jgi:hypothetical protein
VAPNRCWGNMQPGAAAAVGWFVNGWYGIAALPGVAETARIPSLCRPGTGESGQIRRPTDGCTRDARRRAGEDALSVSLRDTQVSGGGGERACRECAARDSNPEPTD